MGTSRANAASLLPVHARQIKDLESEARTEPRTRGAAVGEGDPAAHRSRDRADLTGTGDADGARQAGPQGRRCWPPTCPTRRSSPPGCRATSRPSCATNSVPEIRVAPAAPGDRHHDAGQRPRRHGGHLVRLPGHARTSASARSTRCASYVATDAIFRHRRGVAARSARAGCRRCTSSDRMTLDLRRQIDRAGRWLLNYRPQPLAVGAEINRFAKKVAELTPRMREWLRGDDRAIVDEGGRAVLCARRAGGPGLHRRIAACTSTACSTSSTSPTSSTASRPRWPTPTSR